MQYGKSLWEIKLAHRAKSFWYPYPTLQNIPILARLLAPVGLDAGFADLSTAIEKGDDVGLESSPNLSQRQPIRGLVTA